jgi:GAF domain-containing protein
MAEEIIISGVSREEKYKELYPQIKGLMDGETDLIANLSNLTAAIKSTFNFFWIGFYLVKGQELVLGPFQGPVACTRIAMGKGVCGAAWSQKKTILVPDVERFPGHIACSSLSKSEIVIPVFDKAKTVKMVLDVDSDQLNDFSETDRLELEKICALLEEIHFNE